MLPEPLGLDGVLAAGGNAYVDHGDREMIAHGHLLLTVPKDGILTAIALSPIDSDPEPWVRVDIAQYVTTRWDIPQMLIYRHGKRVGRQPQNRLWS